MCVYGIVKGEKTSIMFQSTQGKLDSPGASRFGTLCAEVELFLLIHPGSQDRWVLLLQLRSIEGFECPAVKYQDPSQRCKATSPDTPRCQDHAEQYLCQFTPMPRTSCGEVELLLLTHPDATSLHREVEPLHHSHSSETQHYFCRLTLASRAEGSY